MRLIGKKAMEINKTLKSKNKKDSKTNMSKVSTKYSIKNPENARIIAKEITAKYKENTIALYHEDCITGMKKKLSDGEVSVVVTSPPYNLGINYGQYDDKMPRKKYLDWIREWANEVRRVLSDDGSLFLNIGGKPSDPWVPFEVLSAIKDLFHLQNTIHWIKAVSIQKNGKMVSFGHYKPINSDRFLNDCHEYVFHLTIKGDVHLDRKVIGVPYEDKSNITRWKIAKDDRRCRGNTWFIPYKTIQNREKERPHPATFPVELVEMCYKLQGLKKIRLAMDPFLGIGNAAVAASRLNLPFIGFEIDHSYIKEAQRNIKRETCHLL